MLYLSKEGCILAGEKIAIYYWGGLNVRLSTNKIFSS